MVCLFNLLGNWTVSDRSLGTCANVAGKLLPIFLLCFMLHGCSTDNNFETKASSCLSNISFSTDKNATIAHIKLKSTRIDNNILCNKVIALSKFSENNTLDIVFIQPNQSLRRHMMSCAYSKYNGDSHQSMAKIVIEYFNQRNCKMNNDNLDLIYQSMAKIKKGESDIVLFDIDRFQMEEVIGSSPVMDFALLFDFQANSNKNMPTLFCIASDANNSRLEKVEQCLASLT
jgi:hypothetical protein